MYRDRRVSSMKTLNTTVDRRGFFRVGGSMAAAAALVTSVSACAPDNAGGADASGEDAGSGDKQPNEDGTIHGAISYELGSSGYDPMTTSAALTIAANWHTMEGLTELDPASLETYNALAADDPKKVDDTTYAVTLRGGAAFRGGRPVVPEGVAFSFARVLNPDNESLYTQFIPCLASLERTDDKTLPIKLNFPPGRRAERLSVVNIVPQEVVEQAPD